MKKLSWWRRALLWIAYPQDWPTIGSYWNPKDEEVLPPRIGVSMGTHYVWYSIEAQPSDKGESQP